MKIRKWIFKFCFSREKHEKVSHQTCSKGSINWRPSWMFYITTTVFLSLFTVIAIHFLLFHSSIVSLLSLFLAYVLTCFKMCASRCSVYVYTLHTIIMNFLTYIRCCMAKELFCIIIIFYLTVFIQNKFKLICIFFHVYTLIHLNICK